MHSCLVINILFFFFGKVGHPFALGRLFMARLCCLLHVILENRWLICLFNNVDFSNILACSVFAFTAIYKQEWWKIGF